MYIFIYSGQIPEAGSKSGKVDKIGKRRQPAISPPLSRPRVPIRQIGSPAIPPGGTRHVVMDDITLHITMYVRVHAYIHTHIYTATWGYIMTFC